MLPKHLLLEKELESIFLHKFPPFPETTKDFFVRYGPYILLVLAVIAVFGLLTAFGILGGMSIASIATASWGGIVFTAWIAIGLSLVSLLLFFLAFTPLKNRQRKGWEYLYYSVLISLTANLITLSIFSLIISGILWFWVLFQIRDRYI